MVICLEQMQWSKGPYVNDLHIVELMPLPPDHLLLQQNPEWLTFLVLAYPYRPGKEAVKGHASVD